MFVALIGVVIFAFAMGNITTLMATTQGARLRFVLAPTFLPSMAESTFDMRSLLATCRSRVLAPACTNQRFLHEAASLSLIHI